MFNMKKTETVEALLEDGGDGLFSDPPPLKVLAGLDGIENSENL